MRHLVLGLWSPEIKFFPGQYVDITVPGTDETRSFSMANTSSKESGQLEFVIRVYPDGVFSRFLDTGLAAGDRLDVTGPFGVFTLRESRDCDLIFIGGGAGMAPILCLLRSLVERASPVRPPTTTGRGAAGTSASRRSCAPSRRRCPGFRYVPALSEPTDDDGWEGEVGFITDVVRRHEGELADVDAYVCGPPPMVEAAMDAAHRSGRAGEAHLLRQVHHDR